MSPDRRRFLGKAGLALAAAAAVPAGAGAGAVEETVRQPDYFSTKGSQVGILYLNNPTGKELGKQYSFKGQLKAQARTVAESIKRPPLDKDTVQGTDWEPLQPVVNTQAVAELALVAAEIQYGTNGREVVAETITKRGLLINYEDQEPTPALDGQPEPFRITLAKEDKIANIPFDGLERSDRRDDFELAHETNELVRKIVQDAAAGILAPNSIPSQLGDLGIVAGAAGFATVATSAEPVARRRFVRWGAVATATVGTLLAAERFNWGGKTTNALASGAVDGADLGQDYNNPSDTFAPLLRSRFFNQEIKGQLIKPTNPANINS
jgi:hypothetical protein